MYDLAHLKPNPGATMHAFWYLPNGGTKPFFSEGSISEIRNELLSAKHKQ